jgi:hypothetical protein
MGAWRGLSWLACGRVVETLTLPMTTRGGNGSCAGCGWEAWKSMAIQPMREESRSTWRPPPKLARHLLSLSFDAQWDGRLFLSRRGHLHWPASSAPENDAASLVEPSAHYLQSVLEDPEKLEVFCPLCHPAHCSRKIFGISLSTHHVQLMQTYR